MGLDTFFFERAKNAPDESQYARVGYFRKLNPLLKWVDNTLGWCETRCFQKSQKHICRRF